MMSRRLFSSLVLLAALGIAVALVAGFLGRLHAAFDTFAHFRVHLALLLAVVSLLLFFQKFRLHGLIGLLLAAGACVSALGFPGTGLGPPYVQMEPKPLSARVYKLVQLNVLYRNENPERVVDMLRQERPDIVTIEEVSERWSDTLKSLLNDFPYQARCGRGSRNDGVAILSREPFSNSRFTQCSERGNLSRASFEIEGVTVDVIAAHYGWPWPFRQIGQIRRNSPFLEETLPDAILAGDLNAVAWSRSAQMFAAASGARLVRPSAATWFFRGPGLETVRPWIGLPIDNVLAKGAVRIHSWRLGAYVNSDHLPVIVEFSVAKADDDKRSETVTASVN